MKLLLILLLSLSYINITQSSETMSAKDKTLYDYIVEDIDGNEMPLEKYKGKVILIVNVASKCG